MSDVDEERRPIKPTRPKHVPFWPVLIGIVFMLAIVVSGLIASDKARKDKLGESIVTSTLPPRHGATSTSTTSTTARSVAAKSSTTVRVEPTTATAQALQSGPGADACTAANLKAAILASGQVDESAIGAISVPKFKCVSGYALAEVDNQKVGNAHADFELQPNKTWKMLDLGDVNPAQDGVPASVVSQLTLD